MDNPTLKRRATDGGPLCWLARRLTEFWDFFDKRDIDKHLMAWATFYVTVALTSWAKQYVEDHADKPGLELAAVIGAALLPWTPVQSFVIKWYFERQDP